MLCIEVTRGLSVNDCRRLFALIRGVNTFEARQIVSEDIMGSSSHLERLLKSGCIVLEMLRNNNAMRPQCFNSETDLPPMPFDERVCRLAQDIKDLGLVWMPHVGCFVWDPDHHIKPDPPFPGRIYFILSLPRFIDLLGSIEAIVEKLVWLPTWHQARLLCRRIGIADDGIVKSWHMKGGLSPCEDLVHVYLSLIDGLRNR